MSLSRQAVGRLRATRSPATPRHPVKKCKKTYHLLHVDVMKYHGTDMNRSTKHIFSWTWSSFSETSWLNQSFSRLNKKGPLQELVIFSESELPGALKAMFLSDFVAKNLKFDFFCQFFVGWLGVEKNSSPHWGGVGASWPQSWPLVVQIRRLTSSPWTSLNKGGARWLKEIHYNILSYCTWKYDHMIASMYLFLCRRRTRRQNFSNFGAYYFHLQPSPTISNHFQPLPPKNTKPNRLRISLFMFNKKAPIWSTCIFD